MSNHHLEAVPISTGKTPSSDKVCQQEQETDKAAAPQSTVTFAYQAKVAEMCCNVTATWCRNHTNHSLCITVQNCQEYHYSCKIDLKSWQFWGKKGLKSFEVDGGRVDVYWDFRQAKLSSTPEPCSDYYVVLMSKQQVVLLLGDLKLDAYRRTRCRPSLEEAKLMYKREHVYGKRLFCSKVRVEVGKKEHDIVIETSLTRPNDPEMCISVDGVTVIRVMNLNWRFRGNESVVMNDKPVQILWDVHDWLFSSQGTRQGLFIFKPGRLDWVSDKSDPDVINCNDGSYSSSSHSQYDSPKDGSSTTGFCHFLYAWKTESDLLSPVNLF